MRALLITGFAGFAAIAAAHPADAQQACLSGGPNGSVSVPCGPAYAGLDQRAAVNDRHVRSTTGAAVPAGRITSRAYADRPAPAYTNVRSYSQTPDAQISGGARYEGGGRAYGGADGRLLGGPDRNGRVDYRDDRADYRDARRYDGNRNYDRSYDRDYDRDGGRFTASYGYSSDPYYRGGNSYYGVDYREPGFRASGYVGYDSRDYRYGGHRIYGGSYGNQYSRYDYGAAYDRAPQGYVREYQSGPSYGYSAGYDSGRGAYQQAYYDQGYDRGYRGETYTQSGGCTVQLYSQEYYNPCQPAYDHRDVQVVRGQYAPQREIYLGALDLTGGVGSNAGAGGYGGGGVVVVNNGSRYSGISGANSGASASASASATARVNAAISVRQSYRGGGRGHYGGGYHGGGKGCNCGGGKGH